MSASGMKDKQVLQEHVSSARVLTSRERGVLVFRAFIRFIERHIPRHVDVQFAQNGWAYFKSLF